MIDVQKVNATKERILSMIKASGPSFPTRISRETSISPLFIGALLSEMVAEQKLVMSSMKVGSSPLYFLRGQEQSLESFLQYLNSKEREAVELLKSSQVLDDSEQEPAMRIALRKVRDFAHPMNVRIDNQEKLYWRYFSLPEEQAVERLSSILNPVKKKKPEQKREDKVEEQKAEKPEEKEVKEAPKEEAEKKEKKKAEKKPSVFATSVKEYLLAKDIEVLADVAVKAKEYHAKVRIDTPLGKQEYFLIAKEKKKITEDDLAIALHKAQAEKMPSLLLAKGDLDKEARPYLENWRNLIKFEKLKL